jgi:uncharacterized protein YjbI with pentapeptide repeats
MPEDKSNCQIHKKYEWIECINAPLVEDTDGLCILHSHLKVKDQQSFEAALRARIQQEVEFYDFRYVFFPGRFILAEILESRTFATLAANFFGATFTEMADFSEATFTAEADFSWATFTEGADFSKSTFTEMPNFFKAGFMEYIDFSQATFTAGAHFFCAGFKGITDFEGVTFTEIVDFSGASFMENAYFSGVTFTARTDFSYATIGGQVIFREINPKKEDEPPAPPFEAEFRYLKFEEKGRLRFQDVSLSHCTFTGTDLRRPEFYHVTWGALGGRQIVYDEVKLRAAEKEKPWFLEWFRSQLLPWLAFHAPYEPSPETPWGDRYGEVERLYRYLKINYETEQDYKNAGDFHYGEMEMHRRASKWRWFPFYWYNLYRFLSGFGERPSWALGWLAVFLVGMAGVVWGLGLEVGKPPHTYMAGFGDSFIYLLQKATLQRPNWADPVDFGGKLVAGLSVLLIPGQAALFLLALRNRLGRRR